MVLKAPVLGPVRDALKWRRIFKVLNGLFQGWFGKTCKFGCWNIVQEHEFMTRTMTTKMIKNTSLQQQ